MTALLALVGFVLLGVAAVITCFRSGKILIGLLNKLFDKIEKKVL